MRNSILITQDLLQSLEMSNIYQKRGGMIRGESNSYINRWKVGDTILFSSCTKIEQYSTIGDGNLLYSIGSFSSSASKLPIGSRVGRYTEISTGLQGFGFRHPIEAVTINSAAFNTSRENVHPYLEAYKELTGEDINPLPIPTPQPQTKPIIIGNDVWIGRDVTIKGGVSIGDGAIIASNSIVTKDVDSYTVVGGAPSKFIKYRFPDEIIIALKESRWWELELGDLYREGLDFSNPGKFLDKLSLCGDNIRKFNPNVFSPLLYKSYGYGDTSEQKKIVSHHGTPIFLDKRNNIFSKTLTPGSTNLYCMAEKNGDMIIKTSEDEFIKVDDHGYVFISHEYKNSTKAIKIQSEDKYSIPCNGGSGFLSATGEGFTIKNHVQGWEKFSII